MDSESFILSDHFTSSRFLLVTRLVGHDMYIATLDAEEQKSGPGMRIYNYGGSFAHIPLFEYFSALANAYGREPNIEPASPELDFPRTPDDIAQRKQLLIRDTPDNNIYVRLISLSQFFGIQTYCLGGNEFSKEKGPVIWLDKGLPKVRDQAQKLDNMICDPDTQRSFSVA